MGSNRTVRHARRSTAPPSVGRLLALFAAGSAAALALAAGGGYLALRSVAVEEAKRDTRLRVQEAASLVESAVTDGLAQSDAESLARVDDLVVGRVLDESVVRAKIWSAEGRVLYSDEPAQIGTRFALSPDQERLLREGGVEVEVTDLDRPENALDRSQGELIEAYTQIRLPSGEPALFEIYERQEAISENATRLLGALAPPILGAVALVLLIQVPLVWSLSRRLQRNHEEREALLANAVAASSRERRRIAAYLHDGPVQDVAGAAFRLAPLAASAQARGAGAEAAEIDETVAQLRQNVRDLRALLVDLHPPRLAAAGLDAAIADLVSPLRAHGVDVEVAISDTDRLDLGAEALVYRVAQEAVRNVIAHADARSVQVSLTVDDRVARLRVVDDGLGFDETRRSARAAEGHVGLSLLEELARQAGGSLAVRSSRGSGTAVELEVPIR